jgi:phosphotransferase system  glucose/maltose/N-acetylglucosamine-specific IIC component
MDTPLMITLAMFVAVLWAWALYDILKAKFSRDSMWMLWIAIIVLLPVLGPILYFQIGKGNLKRNARLSAGGATAKKRKGRKR